MTVKIDVQEGVISLGEDKSVQLDIEPIFWANGCTTYHLYAYGSNVKVYNNICEPEEEIEDGAHIIITDNVSGEI